MANPFNTNANPMGNFDMNSIRNMYKMLTSSGNPIQLFENLASHNPNFQPILNALKSGTSPQAIFESLCKQRGINPQEFLRNIQGKY